MKKRSRHQRQLGQVMTIVGAFLVGGFVLLLHVWLPIQAQRALDELKRCETRLSDQKSELERLYQKYGSLTSLSTLDNWAKKNGPWRTSDEDSTVLIHD